MRCNARMLINRITARSQPEGCQKHAKKTELASSKTLVAKTDPMPLPPRAADVFSLTNRRPPPGARPCPRAAQPHYKSRRPATRQPRASRRPRGPRAARVASVRAPRVVHGNHWHRRAAGAERREGPSAISREGSTAPPGPARGGAAPQRLRLDNQPAASTPRSSKRP